MKKKMIYILVIAIIALSILASCNTTKPENSISPNPSESVSPGTTETPATQEPQEQLTLEQIIEKIYEIKNPELMLGEIPVDLTDADSVKYFTGLSDLSKVKEIAVSETMIGSQAYSLVLVRTKDAADTESVAKEMLNGINQVKWICVDADDLQVVAKGDVIMLFMISSAMDDLVTSEQMVDAFTQVVGTLDVQFKMEFLQE